MSGYCKWCNTLTNSNMEIYVAGKLIWVGCRDCYMKKKGTTNEERKRR